MIGMDEDTMIDHIMVEEAKAKLLPLDREVLEARLSGNLLRDIAAEHGLCVANIQKRERRALDEVRCFFAGIPSRREAYARAPGKGVKPAGMETFYFAADYAYAARRRRGDLIRAMVLGGGA